MTRQRKCLGAASLKVDAALCEADIPGELREDTQACGSQPCLEGKGRTVRLSKDYR